MSEKGPLHHERDLKPSAELLEHQRKTVEDAVEKGHHVTNEHAKRLGEIQNEAKTEALPAKEQLAKGLGEDKPAEPEPQYINSELKEISYKRTLKHTQKRLRAPERALSRFMHNDAVSAVSEVAGKTVARPSGILVGGIVACLGSTIFLWAAKHYGYEYNFLLFALLFVAGFGLGLLIELIYRLVRKPATR